MNTGIRLSYIITILVFSMGFMAKSDNIIGKEGISSLRMEISNLKDIKEIFPNGKKITKKYRMQNRGYAMLSSGLCIEIKGKKYIAKHVTYIDEENGLIFNLGMDNRLYEISFVKPTRYKTNKGIGVGNSFYELDSIYGQIPFCGHISGDCKIHGNLRFFPNDTIVQAELTTDSLNNIESKKLMIEKIVLFKSSYSTD